MVEAQRREDARARRGPQPCRDPPVQQRLRAIRTAYGQSPVWLPEHWRPDIEDCPDSATNVLPTRPGHRHPAYGLEMARAEDGRWRLGTYMEVG